MVSNNNQKLFAKIALGALFIFILSFGFFRAYHLIFGVKIKNINIKNWVTLEENTERITGNAYGAILLTLNGREILVDKKGNFDEIVALYPGYNIIDLEAKDKFGSKDHKNYQLIYKPKNEKEEY